MKTKRLILMLMILALLTPLALSGCSDKTESSSQDSADDDSENDSDFEQIKGQSWMSTLDSSLSLGAIAMPGTHDSGATKDLVLPGTARCQSLTIAEQLDIGVRYFDIRLRRVDGDLRVYHGEADQELTFTQVLGSCYSFLEANPSEAIIMCIKEEADPKGSGNSPFESAVKKQIEKNADFWYFGSDVPSLEAVRGKIVLWRRYSAAGEFGFAADSGWSDNTTFTMRSGKSTLKCQDYYDNESPEKKWEETQEFFSQMTGKKNTYYLCNTSGYVSNLLGIPNINTTCDYINPLLLEHLKSSPDLKGIIATDFMTKEIAKAVYSLNFD